MLTLTKVVFMNEKLNAAAERAIKYCIGIRKGEKLLLVTDKQKINLAEAFAVQAKKLGAEVTTYLMTETLRPILEPTSLFRQMSGNADVLVYVLEGRAAEKPFRGFMVKQGRTYGRVCMLPGLTVEMMERLVNVDYDELRGFSEKVADYIRNKDIIIRNPEGTDVSFSLKGRKIELDIGELGKKGTHGNLPAGEVFTAPVEETMNGTVIFGLIDEYEGKGKIVFEKGKATEISGDNVQQILKTIGSDETARIIGEFGIGTNPGARICNNLLEAEKAFGTVHFAIGDSYDLGKNKSEYHFDCLVSEPDVIVGGKYLMKKGKFLFE